MTGDEGRERPATIAGLQESMRERLASLPPEHAFLGDFLSTYLRMTTAVAAAIEAGRFDDPSWVERWDLEFADRYLVALDAYLSGNGRPSRPWRLAFNAAPTPPPLLNVLLGVNAHINYDLPQALLAVITDAEFGDPSLLARRRRDHDLIGEIISGQVATEDGEISSRSVRTVVDRLLRPVNRWAARRFLNEARERVWTNTAQLWRVKTSDAAAYTTKLAELELLSAARIFDLLRPGNVLLRLAAAGFGVSLPPDD